jgi:hypothetical protein
LCAEHARAAGSYEVRHPCRDCPEDAKKEAAYPDEQGVNKRLCAEHARAAGSHQVQRACRDWRLRARKRPEDAKKCAAYPDEQGVNKRLCATHAYVAGTVAKPYSGASRIACEAWHRLEHVLHLTLQHIHFVPGQDVPDGTEFRIPGTRYHVDAYHPETQTIYEYLGNHVHGYPPEHPRFTTESAFLLGRTNSELYTETMERLTLIASKAFRVYYVWHHEYTVIQNKPFANMSDCLRRIHP